MNIFRKSKGSGRSSRPWQGRRRPNHSDEPEGIEMTDVSTWRNPPGGGGQLNAPPQVIAPPVVPPQPIPAAPPPPPMMAPRQVAPAAPVGADQDKVDIGRQFNHPLFPQRYVREKQSDTKSGLSWIKHKAKEGIQDKREEIQEEIEAFREKSTTDKAKTVGTFAARKLAGQIPFASSAISAGDAVNSHLQMQEAQEVADQDGTSEVMGSLATGESRHYQRERNRQGIGAVTSAVSSAVGLATAGTLASVAKTAGTAAANFAGGQISDRLIDGETNLPELRQRMAQVPQTRQEEIERGETGLQLAQQTPGAAHAMVGLLNRKPLSFQEEFALNVRQQQSERPTSIRPTLSSRLGGRQSGVETQPMLRPSAVKRAGLAESSRVKFREREQTRLRQLQQIGNTTLMGRGVNALRNRAANRPAQVPQDIPLQPMNPPPAIPLQAAAPMMPAQEDLQARFNRLRQPNAPAEPTQDELLARMDNIVVPNHDPNREPTQEELLARMDNIRVPNHDPNREPTQKELLARMDNIVVPNHDPNRRRVAIQLPAD